MNRTLWKGFTFDTRTAAMLTEADRLLTAAGFGFPFRPAQGSYHPGVGASAGTHDRGGAVDIALAYSGPGGQLVEASDAEARTIETVLRRVGFAAWYRVTIPGTWTRHVHGIAIGCADLAPLASVQTYDYRAGRDGLRGNGPDTGARGYVGTTWETYLAHRDTAGSSIPNLPSTSTSTSTSTAKTVPTHTLERPEVMPRIIKTEGKSLSTTADDGQVLLTDLGIKTIPSPGHTRALERYIACLSDPTNPRNTSMLAAEIDLVNAVLRS